MKYLIFSDIHGNLPALEKVLASEKVDGYLNLGDVVNYAPWSNECVEIVNDLSNCLNILGNHETYFIENKCEVKHPLVQLFFRKCISDFKNQPVISTYKNKIEVKGFNCTHTLNNQYVFHDSELIIDNHTIIGHSHQQYSREINGFILINPGSIGQNRKYINVANYAIWNTETNTFDLRHLTFDVDLVIKEMKIREYPQECIDYYKNKKRLNA